MAEYFCQDEEGNIPSYDDYITGVSDGQLCEAQEGLSIDALKIEYKRYAQRNKESFPLVPIFQYQKGTYTVYGHQFTVSRGVVVSSNPAGKGVESRRDFMVAFEQGRAATYQLKVGACEDKTDEVAQMAVHDLIKDRILHWEHKEKEILTYLYMLHAECRDSATKKDVADKAKELHDSLNSFSFPSFIVSSDRFRFQFDEVQEYRTKDAFESVYPIVEKDYERPSPY